MVQTHPQWVRTVELVRTGRIGKLRFAMGSFGYFRSEPENVRNVRAYGGGGLLDIGCYPIKVSRMVIGEEPVRVSATLVRDPRLRHRHSDLRDPRVSIGALHLLGSTQSVPHQSMQFFGTTGRIELEVPYNAPTDAPSRIRIDDGRDVFGSGITVEEFAPCDQYTLQADAFSSAIREGGRPPVPLEDAIKNMAVIDAVFRAAETGKWEKVGGEE